MIRGDRSRHNCWIIYYAADDADDDDCVAAVDDIAVAPLLNVMGTRML